MNRSENAKIRAFMKKISSVGKKTGGGSSSSKADPARNEVIADMNQYNSQAIDLYRRYKSSPDPHDNASETIERVDLHRARQEFERVFSMYASYNNNNDAELASRVNELRYNLSSLIGALEARIQRSQPGASILNYASPYAHSDRGLYSADDIFNLTDYMRR